MPDETPLDHLLSARARQYPGGVEYPWRDRLEPETVVLTFGFPFPESFPRDDLVSAARALLEAEPNEALQYGGGEAAQDLPGIVAERAPGRGIECTADEVLVTNGATDALDLVCRTFLDPGDAVVVEAPTFTWSLAVVRSHGVETVGVEMDGDGLDADALADELARRRREELEMPKLVYTIPNFQNPTGVTLVEQRRKRLLDLAATYDFVVVEDDAYGELRFEGEDVAPLRALDDDGRVIHLGTFSKTIAPGVRTGWAIADQPLVDRLGSLHTGGPNAFTAGLIATYCREGYLEAAVPELRGAYRDRRDHLLSCLDRHMPKAADWTEPKGGFFVWVELPETVDTVEMLPDAVEAGVAYLPGSMFYVDGGGEHSLRLSFSWAPLDAIEGGVAALGRTVEGHRGK